MDAVTAALTFAAGFVYTVGFSAGLYEAVTVMPAWFADPPRSFLHINERSSQVPRFWIPVQVATTTLLVAAIVANLGHDEVRNYLTVSAACFVAALLSTVLYFLRRVRHFMQLAGDRPTDSALTAQGRRWYSLSLLRTLALGAGSIAALLALAHTV